MKKITALMECFLILVTLSSCAGLPSKSRNAQSITKDDAPEACVYIGEVSIGEGQSYSSESAINDAMRSKSRQMGGNFLVVDAIQSMKNDKEEFVGYSGTGKAYSCPDNLIQNPAN